MTRDRLPPVTSYLDYFADPGLSVSFFLKAKQTVGCFAAVQSALRYASGASRSAVPSGKNLALSPAQSVNAVSSSVSQR